MFFRKSVITKGQSVGDREL